MAIEIIIGGCLVALCALTGRAAAMKRVYEADGIRRFQEDILHLKMLTLEKRIPLASALLNLKEPLFKTMGAYMTEDAYLASKDAWIKAAGNENAGAETVKTIEILFSSCESLSRDQQAAQYDRARDDLKKLEEEKRKQGLEKVRLYTSLGAVTGVCIFLFCV